MSTTIEPPITFKKYGEIFRQVKRKGPIAIFEREKEGRHRKLIEVVILKDTKEYVLGGVTIAAKKDGYPGESAWGKSAWSPHDMVRAEEMFDNLVKTRLDENDNLKVGQRGRPAKQVDVTVEAIDGDDETVIDVSPKEAGRRGRKKVDRSSLILPDSDKWTIQEAADLNKEVSKALVYQFVVGRVKEGKVVVAGNKTGGRGKPTLLYRKASGDVTVVETVVPEVVEEPMPF